MVSCGTPDCGPAPGRASRTSRVGPRGVRGYVVGTEDGRFLAMGFSTRGEMGGVWTPPMGFLDGIWFGIGDDLRVGAILRTRFYRRFTRL